MPTKKKVTSKPKKTSPQKAKSKPAQKKKILKINQITTHLV